VNLAAKVVKQTTSNTKFLTTRENSLPPGKFLTNTGKFLTTPGKFLTTPGKFLTTPGKFVTTPGNIPYHLGLGCARVKNGLKAKALNILWRKSFGVTQRHTDESVAVRGDLYDIKDSSYLDSVSTPTTDAASSSSTQQISASSSQTTLNLNEMNLY